MFRSVGSTIFGLAADRYGRKWPFVINNLLFIVLELGTGFAQTYPQFLAIRALFGVAMGGLYGNAAATALEDAPDAARGLLSGILQQGYAFGYLLATVFARALVDTTPHGWRPLYWFGACPPILLIIFRLMLPETDSYIESAAIREELNSAGKVFITEGKVALKKHWLLLIYMVLLMAGFNFMVIPDPSSNPPSSCTANTKFWDSRMAPKTYTLRFSKTNSSFPPTESPSLK